MEYGIIVVVFDHAKEQKLFYFFSISDIFEKFSQLLTFSNFGLILIISWKSSLSWNTIIIINVLIIEKKKHLDNPRKVEQRKYKYNNIYLR